jgi:hypothetical protein
MATTVSGKELAEELPMASRARALHTLREQVSEAALPAERSVSRLSPSTWNPGIGSR